MGDFIPHIFVIVKFKLIDNLKFVNVDLNYLKKLYEISSEVYFKESDYQNKPYLDILLSSDSFKYVIPLTSAKEKHKYWLEKDAQLIQMWGCK